MMNKVKSIQNRSVNMEKDKKNRQLKREFEAFQRKQKEVYSIFLIIYLSKNKNLN